MVWLARIIEEPLRGLITMFGALAAVVVIPWLTDIEGRVDGLITDTAGSAVLYLGMIVFVILASGVIGYLLGLALTWPIRYVIKKDDMKRYRHV